MIEKLDKKMEFVEISVLGNKKAECLDFEAGRRLNLKINELIDAVNELHEEAENNARIRADHENLINTLVAENNIHEKQIDELQMKLEPKKCEPAENMQDENPKCPFCGEELSYAQEIDGGFKILTCDCPHGIWLFGNDKMWYNLEKAITELDRTKKQLEAAKTLITEIKTVIAEQDLEPQEL